MAFEKKLYYITKDRVPFENKNEYIKYELHLMLGEDTTKTLIKNKTEIMALLAGWEQNNETSRNI